MFASLAVGLYLLGLVLRNQQLVTVAVVLLSFLTYAAFRTTHADGGGRGAAAVVVTLSLLAFVPQGNPNPDSP